MLTGEHNYVAALEDQSDSVDFFSSLDTYIIGSYNSFFYKDRMDEAAAAFVWFLEPFYANFVKDRVNMTEGTEFGGESFGKFLFRRGKYLTQEEVSEEAMRLYMMKRVYDDPLGEPSEVSVAALVNDYAPPENYGGGRSAADKVTAVLGAVYASPYFG